jgi:hypothetical protein
MHVLLIGHAQIKSFQDPELPSAYDRYQLKINERAAALVREAADAVLFARFETELVKVNGSKPKARGEGNRIMYTESRPGWDAKNRFNLPFCMPLDWKSFGEAIRAFYGLNGKGNSTVRRRPEEEQSSKTEPKNESQAVTTQEKPFRIQQQSEPQNGSESPALAELRARLEENKISEPEFLDILRCAQISQAAGASRLADLPDKTLGLAVGSWDTIGFWCKFS